jgi:hypothetical protein
MLASMMVAENIAFYLIAAMIPKAMFCATITLPPRSATTCDASAMAVTGAPS